MSDGKPRVIHQFILPTLWEAFRNMQQSDHAALTWVEDNGSHIHLHALFDTEEACAAYLESAFFFGSSTEVYEYPNTQSGTMWMASTLFSLGSAKTVDKTAFQQKWDDVWERRAKTLREKLEKAYDGLEGIDEE